MVYTVTTLGLVISMNSQIIFRLTAMYKQAKVNTSLGIFLVTTRFYFFSPSNIKTMRIIPSLFSLCLNSPRAGSHPELLHNYSLVLNQEVNALRHLAGFPEAYYLQCKDLLSSHIPQSSQGFFRKSGKIKGKATSLRGTKKAGSV